MKKVSVVIPNYNGMKYLKICLDSLKTQTLQEFDVICVDNGSADESVAFIEKEYPYVQLIKLDTNTGFCHAVNVGIQNAKTEYVVLLNNDTQAEPEFLEELCKGMEGNPHIFSGCAKILQYHDRTKMDDAGDYTMRLDGLLQEEKENRRQNLTNLQKYSLPVVQL